MTNRASEAQEQRRRAVAAWNNAQDHAGRIGPRSMQTVDTMSQYERAQAMLTEAEAAYVAAGNMCASIPSVEFAY